MDKAGHNLLVTQKAQVYKVGKINAVLLVGECLEPVNVPRELLPTDLQEGKWLNVEMKEDRVMKAEYDPDETERIGQRYKKMMERFKRVGEKKARCGSDNS